MGLRIRTNVESLSSQRFLSNNNTDMGASIERLASGSRINRSADDAAGLAISENLRAKVRGMTQAKRNANDGVSLIQVAEGSLSEMSNILIRMRELTIQAASDTVDMTGRDFLNREYQELNSEIDRIFATTEFNGRVLLGPSGGENSITLQVGYNGTPDDVLKLALGDNPDGINAETLGVKETLLNTEDRNEITANLDKIDKGLMTIASSRATLGATQSRLNTAINNISVSVENQQAANSRIRDADFAEETAKLTQSRILSQAGLSVLSQANMRPEMALSLLRS